MMRVTHLGRNGLELTNATMRNGKQERWLGHMFSLNKQEPKLAKTRREKPPNKQINEDETGD
jgi:hypothetical protein